MVPISEAMLLPTLPARISDMMEEENSSRIISRVVYPIVNLGMSGELIFSEIWMAITVPIKMEMMTTIQRESTPNLYISFINCLKNMLHRLGTEMHFPINMTYSPTWCNALFIILCFYSITVCKYNAILGTTVHFRLDTSGLYLI